MSEPVNPNHSPNNSFGNNPPVPQHQPGNAENNAAFYGQQTESSPAPVKKNRTGLIAGAAIAGLLVLGGGAYAVTSVLNVAGDKDIAKAVPSNSALFVQVDLNPSNSQKAAALTLASKIDALVDEDDEYNTEGKDFKEIATDPAFEDLDYETEVKPWIGDKVAVAAWGDFSSGYRNSIAGFQDGYANGSNDDYSEYSESPSTDYLYENDPANDYYDDDYLDGKYDDLDKMGEDGKGVDVVSPSMNTVSHSRDGVSKEDTATKPSVVLVYEVKNKDKAKQAAEKVIERDDDLGAYTIHGGYLVLAENDEIISDYVDSLEKSNLAANETYVSDMKILGGDNIASSWLDISQMGVDGYLQDIGFSEDGEDLRGRLATGVSLTKDGVTSQTKVIGLEGYESFTGNAPKGSTGINDLGNFSKDSSVAISVSGLSEYAEAALAEYEKKSPESVESFLEGAESAGFNFPEDFKKIFGSETGIGYVISSGDDTSYEYRATGADTDTIKDLVEEAGGESFGLDVSTDGDTTVLKFAPEGGLSSEKLSSHEKFTAALKDLDKANGAIFINIDAIAEAKNTESQKEDKDYGVLGATSSHDEKSNVSDFTVRWIF